MTRLTRLGPFAHRVHGHSGVVGVWRIISWVSMVGYGAFDIWITRWTWSVMVIFRHSIE